MKQKQRAKWELTRAKGMWRFVLLYGVLLWGGFMIIARAIFDFFFSRPRFMDNLSIIVPTFLVAGFIFGLAVWFIGEYMYRKSSSNASSI